MAANLQKPSFVAAESEKNTHKKTQVKSNTTKEQHKEHHSTEVSVDEQNEDHFYKTNAHKNTCFHKTDLCIPCTDYFEQYLLQCEFSNSLSLK